MLSHCSDEPRTQAGELRDRPSGEMAPVEAVELRRRVGLDQHDPGFGKRSERLLHTREAHTLDEAGDPPAGERGPCSREDRQHVAVQRRDH